MLAVVLVMLLCVALAAAVVAVVAVPARRSGRELLTERGESVVENLVEGRRSLAAKASRPTPRHATRPDDDRPPTRGGDEVLTGRS